jgi:hypothetical protein
MPGVLSPQMQNRFDKAQRNGVPSGPPVDAAALAMKLARPAPDNSTFTSYLTDAGYEIRTFKDHPQLKKVEKKTTNDGTVSIKVVFAERKSDRSAGTGDPESFKYSCDTDNGRGGIAVVTTYYCGVRVRLRERSQIDNGETHRYLPVLRGCPHDRCVDGSDPRT